MTDTAATTANRISFTVELDRENIASALTSAFEHGIGYWASIVDVSIPDAVVAAMTPAQRDEIKSWGRTVFAAMTPGCYVELGAKDDGLDTTARLTIESIQTALGVLAAKWPRCFQIVSTGGDANSGDVLVQVACFGDEMFA